MTYYVVVSRDKKTPQSRELSVTDAANYIIKKRAFTKFKVLAQDGSELAPMRELMKHEAKTLEQKLYPNLWEMAASA